MQGTGGGRADNVSPTLLDDEAVFLERLGEVFA